MKRKWLLRAVFGSILIYLLIQFIIPNYKFFRESNLSDGERAAKTRMAREEYTTLFKDEVTSGLYLSDNYLTRSKHPYACYSKKAAYTLIIHKVNLIGSYKNSIIAENGKAETSSNVIYAGYENSFINFKYSFEYDSIAENIILTYDGEIKDRVIAGDSLVYYNLSAAGVAIRYEMDGAQDIVLNNRARPRLLTDMQVVFYRKGNAVYIIIAYPQREVPGLYPELRAMLK